MTQNRRKSLTSVALGAAIGTAAFHGVLALMAVQSWIADARPTLFETVGIYLFFFAVMWLSRRPLARPMP